MPRLPDACIGLVACAVITSVGCSDGAEPPAAAPSATALASAPTASASADVPLDPKAAAARYVATMQGLAKLFEENPKACGGLAEKLRAYRKKHAAVLDAPAPELFGAIEADEKLRETMKTSMATVMDGSMACRDNPGFQKLHAELGARARKAGL